MELIYLLNLFGLALIKADKNKSRPRGYLILYTLSA